MSSRRVNVIEFDDENDFRPIYSDVYTTIGVGPISNMNPFPPRVPRVAPRVVTPERPQRENAVEPYQVSPISNRRVRVVTPERPRTVSPER